jgi:uncharacterized protein (DUF2249 family)
MCDPGPTVLLDVRLLPAPEPFRLIMESLATLPAGACLKVLHRREPFPLYPVLARSGFSVTVERVEHAPDTEFILYITRSLVSEQPDT